MPPVPLALLLLRASRWFDRRLLDGLEAAGWPRLTPAQSLLFAHLDPQGVAPAALARRLGTTRQGTQELVAGLVRHDLLAVQDDPARRGGRLVVLTATGHALTADARRLLALLEGALGVQRAEQLRELLTHLDTPPTTPSAGEAVLPRRSGAGGTTRSARPARLRARPVSGPAQ